MAIWCLLWTLATNLNVVSWLCCLIRIKRAILPLKCQISKITGFRSWLELRPKRQGSGFASIVRICWCVEHPSSLRFTIQKRQMPLCQRPLLMSPVSKSCTFLRIQRKSLRCLLRIVTLNSVIESRSGLRVPSAILQ